MFPQEHATTSLIDTGSSSSLEQIIMLQQQQFSYAPMPINPDPIIMERSITSSTTRWKPNIEVAPNCPRCASTNTKFCYYNNYSLSQPRYFCKGCRRYWTKGGSLRNVPVGGGCRKNRRGKAARHSESERLSAINNNSDDSRESLSAGDQGSETNNGSRDIDMALVFAKFLNQKPTSNEEYGSSSTSNNLSNSLTTTTPESGENIDKDVVVQPQKKGSEFDGDDPLGLLLGGVHVEGSMENFIDELDGFDDVWRDDDAAVTYCWQPPPLPSPPPPTMMQMQLQELEEYAIAPLLNEEGGHHHHHRELTLPAINSSNSMDLLISEGWSTNWGSFDLSTTDVFSSSRPSFIN